MIHSSQIIDSEDVSIRWSATGSISSFADLGIISNYSLSVQWQTKEIIPVNRQFEETVKMAIKGTLNLTTLTDKGFEMPDPVVWIELGLLVRKLNNAGRWQWNRTGKYLITNDTVSEQPDGLVQHQYTLVSQGGINSELVFSPGAAIIQSLSISIISGSSVEGN